VKALEDDHDKPELYSLTEKELMEVASLLIYHGSVVKKPKRKKSAQRDANTGPPQTTFPGARDGQNLIS